MLLAVVGSALGYSYVQRGLWRSPSTPENHRRAGRVVCWTGSTVARYEIKGVPISYLYAQYADLRRMTEWSPSLESVSISPEKPTNSVWVMRVPRAIQAAARTVGYPEPTIEWEAVLDAPGPPLMTWTSEIRDDGSHQNAGFIPSGAVAFAPTDDDVAGAGEEHACEMTLTLSYTLPDPVEWWLLAIINSPVVQGIVRNRIRAGMVRFASTVTAEYQASLELGSSSTPMQGVP